MNEILDISIVCLCAFLIVTYINIQESMLCANAYTIVYVISFHILVYENIDHNFNLILHSTTKVQTLVHANADSHVT